MDPPDLIPLMGNSASKNSSEGPIRTSASVLEKEKSIIQPKQLFLAPVEKKSGHLYNACIFLVLRIKAD